MLKAKKKDMPMDVMLYQRNIWWYFIFGKFIQIVHKFQEMFASIQSYESFNFHNFQFTFYFHNFINVRANVISILRIVCSKLVKQ